MVEHRDRLVFINTFEKTFASMRRSQKNRSTLLESKARLAKQADGSGTGGWKEKGHLLKVLKCSRFIAFAHIFGIFVLHKGPIQLVLVDICKILRVEVNVVALVFATEIFSSSLKMFNSVSSNPNCGLLQAFPGLCYVHYCKDRIYF